ncbi:hypothetical protein CEXT_377141 [Caerostris extrusa]|uniref:Uncharacterized protein n=1 Tax=Caerostris extrusa TaxID=172846 RepID=A0AAV4W0F8_CAEEX|nr:hypothetical protein CEXT_377141 [Caerostris extrusa]
MTFDETCPCLDTKREAFSSVSHANQLLRNRRKGKPSPEANHYFGYGTGRGPRTNRIRPSGYLMLVKTQNGGLLGSHAGSECMTHTVTN